MEKILITGNEGFLGKEIYKALLNRGCELYGFDSLSGDDILDETNIYGAIAKVDTVIHLAGLPHMPQCNGDPVKAIETNILGTAHVLNACVKHKIKRLIYISSAYVFSREGGIYRVTKKCCEEMIKEYHKQFKLDFTIVRCGSVYGKGANKYNFIYSLIKSEIKNDDMPKGNPKDLREYIHVKDVAKGIIKILDEKYKNKSILLSGLAPVSTQVLYGTIREILGKKTGVSFMKENRDNHYKITPYSYDEIENDKIVLDSYIDFGAGLLEMVKDVKRGRNSRINTY